MTITYPPPPTQGWQAGNTHHTQMLSCYRPHSIAKQGRLCFHRHLSVHGGGVGWVSHHRGWWGVGVVRGRGGVIWGGCGQGGVHPPNGKTPGYGQPAVGTHPSGMLSSFSLLFFLSCSEEHIDSGSHIPIHQWEF